MPGRAHRHRDPLSRAARPRQPDLQRFLGGEAVLVPADRPVLTGGDLVHTDACAGPRATVPAHGQQPIFEGNRDRPPGPRSRGCAGTGGDRDGLETSLRGDGSRRLDQRGLLRAGAGRLPVPGLHRVHAARDGPADLAGRLLQPGRAAAGLGALPARPGPDRAASGVPADPGRRDVRGLPLPRDVAAGVGGRRVGVLAEPAGAGPQGAARSWPARCGGPRLLRRRDGLPLGAHLQHRARLRPGGVPPRHATAR